MTPSASPKQSIAADTCDLMNRIDSSLTSRAVLSDQLHSSHLMRMWRTGALMMAYTADEDEDFDVSVVEKECIHLHVVLCPIMMYTFSLANNLENES